MSNELRKRAMQSVKDAAQMRAEGYGLTGWEVAAEMLGVAWLSEHSSDDSELLTVDWISAASAAGPLIYRGFVVQIGPLEYEPRAEEAFGPVELHPIGFTGRVLATRGDLRRLANAIGEPLIEGRTT